MQYAIKIQINFFRLDLKQKLTDFLSDDLKLANKC